MPQNKKGNALQICISENLHALLDLFQFCLGVISDGWSRTCGNWKEEKDISMCLQDKCNLSFSHDEVIDRTPLVLDALSKQTVQIIVYSLMLHGSVW